MLLHGRIPVAVFFGAMLCLLLSCSTDTTIDASQAKKLAIRELKERGYEVDNYMVTVELKKEDNEFTVFFERQPSQMGAHADVRVNRDTGELTVFGGE